MSHDDPTGEWYRRLELGEANEPDPILSEPESSPFAAVLYDEIVGSADLYGACPSCGAGAEFICLDESGHACLPHADRPTQPCPHEPDMLELVSLDVDGGWVSFVARCSVCQAEGAALVRNEAPYVMTREGVTFPSVEAMHDTLREG